MKLKKVSKELPNGLMEFLYDFNKGENGVVGPHVDDLNFSVESYINSLINMENIKNLKPGYVSESSYWLLDENDQVIGISKLRHDLTKELLNRGGHISYYLKKSERGKGIGTLLLKKILVEAKKLGIEKVLITTDVVNVSSIGIIIKNNGKLEDPRYDEKSKQNFNRYWISLNEI
ncbi:GNAT family N-acetyltransferase [Alkaliphilus hydrothermalis]|uniref:Acetyltransferase n=1 Tax=Alkaliphilus hydrothermalis TaxID=1482730 RepID=A0ABS2NMZ9_9FIRM|nr:GNAT family N-acetyltransferase [Alkaliphilus hydrothermalis]MBM7614330.1 putative acetyltransferase [Alkaliphilus hydrothermalis]